MIRKASDLLAYLLTSFSVILSRAKDPRERTYIRHRLGSFAWLRMTGKEMAPVRRLVRLQHYLICSSPDAGRVHRSGPRLKLPLPNGSWRHTNDTSSARSVSWDDAS